MSSEAADADKNGRISLLEAFTYASGWSTQHYEQAGTMATETAMLDDNGDGKGRDGDRRPGRTGASRRSRISTWAWSPTSTDPEVQKLLVRQQALTEQVDDLRRRQR